MRETGVLRITANQGTNLFARPRAAPGHSGIDCNEAPTGMNMGEWVTISGEIGLTNLCSLLQIRIAQTPVVCPRVKAPDQGSASAGRLRFVFFMGSRADLANHGVTVCIQIRAINQMSRSALVV